MNMSFISGVCKSVRTNEFIADGGKVFESVLELVGESEFGPITYYINGAVAEVGCEVSVKCCWVALGDEQGYYSANPYDLFVFGNEVDWFGPLDAMDMEFADAPF